MAIDKAPVQQKGLTSTLNPEDVADDVAGESGDHGVVPSPEMRQALATATAEEAKTAMQAAGNVGGSA